MSLDTRDITFAGAGVALLAVSAWVSLALGPVPFTLQTMALAFVLCAMRPNQALASVLTYLVVGALGVPVFAGMRGGVGVLAGPSGGFLVGFAVAAALAVGVRRLVRSRGVSDVCVVVLMLVCSYGVGWAWLMASTGMGAAAAFASACAPFIVPDVMKCAAGIALARAVRRAVPSLVA